MATKHTQLTQERAEELLAEFQKLLRLQDWSIRVVLSKASGKGFGKVTSDKYKNAVITLYDPSKIKDIISDPDPALTLVHEITHTHFAGISAIKKIKDGSDDDNKFEFAVEAIAQALLTLYRRAEAAEANQNHLA